MSKILLQTAIQIDGMEALEEMLGDVAPREARQINRNAVHGLAGLVRDQMKANVKVDTGEVRDGIYALRRRGKPDFPVSEVRIRKTDHGIMLEFGTSKTKPQPYIVPTVEQMRPQMTQYFREQMGEKLEKALARKAKKAAA
jgi:HK97 gp10 family phage protein